MISSRCDWFSFFLIQIFSLHDMKLRRQLVLNEDDNGSGLVLLYRLTLQLSKYFSKKVANFIARPGGV